MDRPCYLERLLIPGRKRKYADYLYDRYKEKHKEYIDIAKKKDKLIEDLGILRTIVDEEKGLENLTVTPQQAVELSKMQSLMFIAYAESRDLHEDYLRFNYDLDHDEELNVKKDL